MGAADVTAEAFEQLRPLLFGIAYRMLGSVGEAEDVVQEAFLRLERAGTVDSPRAFLTTVVTRLAIDALRSARARRETYVGTWLPEPLVQGHGPDPAEHVERADSVSIAFLVVLETLSPVERAVFVLHDVLGYGFAEIAPIVDRSEANCRQIAARARRHVDARRARFEAPPEKRDELAERFLAAAEGGDVESLVELLAEDAALYGDGGGRAPAIARPVEGRQRVAKVVAGLTRQAARMRLRQRAVIVNGQLGAMYVDADGRVANVVALDIGADGITAVRSIVNPDKLRHLGEPADVAALLRAR